MIVIARGHHCRRAVVLHTIRVAVNPLVQLWGNISASAQRNAAEMQTATNARSLFRGTHNILIALRSYQRDASFATNFWSIAKQADSQARFFGLTARVAVSSSRNAVNFHPHAQRTASVVAVRVRRKLFSRARPLLRGNANSNRRCLDCQRWSPITSRRPLSQAPRRDFRLHLWQKRQVGCMR